MAEFVSRKTIVARLIRCGLAACLAVVTCPMPSFALRPRAAARDGGILSDLTARLGGVLAPDGLTYKQHAVIGLMKAGLEVDGNDDYFVKPTVVEPGAEIRDGDAVIQFDFRGDRAEPIMRLLTADPSFKQFPLKKILLKLVPFAVYNDKYQKANGLEGVVKESSITNTLGEVLAANGKTQARIAESEKFKHVYWFFDGLRDLRDKLWGMVAVKINSNDIDKHWKKPEMKAKEIAAEARQWILGESGKEKKDFVLVNFANLDILGHFDQFGPIVDGAIAVDQALGVLRETVRQAGGVLIVTADHGSGEQKVKLDESGMPLLRDGKPIPHKAHAFDNKVPFIIEGAGRLTLKSGGELSNIAPTVLELMGIAKPAEMTSESLLIDYTGGPVKGPVVLVIRDGWGISKFGNPEALQYNAVRQASLRCKQQNVSFNDDELMAECPHTELWAHGRHAGHPDYQMGDSEAGHESAGAGRQVDSTLYVLDHMLASGEFARSEVVHTAIEGVKRNNGTLHLVGMLSSGGVHSHIEHLFKLLEMIAKEKGVKRVVFHPIFDGRDIETSETPGWQFMRQVFRKANELGFTDETFQVGVYAGRYYPKDRDAFNKDGDVVFTAADINVGILRPMVREFKSEDPNLLRVHALVLKGLGAPAALASAEDYARVFNRLLGLDLTGKGRDNDPVAAAAGNAALLSAMYASADGTPFETPRGLQSHGLWMERLKPWYDAIIDGKGRTAEGVRQLYAARELGADAGATAGFLAADHRIFETAGGKELVALMRALRAKFVHSHAKGAIAAVVVDAGYFRAKGAVETMRELSRLRPYIEIGVYGEGCAKVKALLFDDDLIAEKKQEDVIKALESRGFSRDAITVMQPRGDRNTLPPAEALQTLTRIPEVQALDLQLELPPIEGVKPFGIEEDSGIVEAFVATYL